MFGRLILCQSYRFEMPILCQGHLFSVWILFLSRSHPFEEPILCQGPLDEGLLSTCMMLILSQRHRLSEMLVSNLSIHPIAVCEQLIRPTRVITVVDLIIF